MDSLVTLWARELIMAGAAVLAADFISGFVHWAEDAYARADTPIIGRWIGAANLEHHARPRAFVSKSWWASSWDLALPSSALVLLAAWQGWLVWQLLLFAVLAANANQIHKWAHQTRAENGPVVSFLQDWRIIQTKRHHAVHHSGHKNSHYCAITNVLNPVLERMRVWAALEWLLAQVGLQRKCDPTVRAALAKDL